MRLLRVLLLIQRVRVGVEVRQHSRGIRDWLAILIWMVGVDIIIEELRRRLNGLLRLLRLLLQIRRVGTVMWRWIAHRPGAQLIHIESFQLRTVNVASLFVFLDVLDRCRPRSLSKDRRRIGETTGRSGQHHVSYLGMSWMKYEG